MLRNALFAQDPIAADAGALKAHHKAPDLETPATKRPKRGNEHSYEVINVDAIQGDESFDASNDDDQDISSASGWQASEQLASFLGTLHIVSFYCLNVIKSIDKDSFLCKFNGKI